MAEHPLSWIEKPDPTPGPREVLVRVVACGVCRTDLHLAEGDLPSHGVHVVPGHEVVGRVIARGPDATRFERGERIGIAWLRHTCGACRFCVGGDENLCVAPQFTGWDADGGYAELAVVDERYAYAIPDRYSDEAAAPLLCAGIIGYRALRQSALPSGGRLGIFGFGASAHLAAQIAVHQGARVHVFTRAVAARRLALELGCVSAADTFDAAPESLDAAIVFAPAGEIVPAALSAVDRGGTVAIAGIHLSDVPPLNYARHLFQERRLRSVTANTREDGGAFLDLAARIPLRVETTRYPLEQADRALTDLAADRVNGAAVLVSEGDGGFETVEGT
jgi:alcohol dehydrogenase, propanol-preferring